MEDSIKSKVKKAHHSSPDVIIGKNGVSEQVLNEIKNRLKIKEVVKVKVLRTGIEAENGIDRRELARLIAEKVGARLMGIRGRTFILYKPAKESK